MKRWQQSIPGRMAAWAIPLLLLPSSRAEIVTGGTLYVSVSAAQITDLVDGQQVVTWSNKGNGAISDFTITGAPFASLAPTYNASIGGVPAVTFYGQAGEHLATWGTTAPADITGNGSFTAEAWAYNPDFIDHETLINWAHRGTVLRYATLSFGSHAVWGAVGHWDWPDMGFDTGNPSAGEWHHIAATYDGAIERVYVDGRLCSLEGKYLDIWPDDPFVLGASQNGMEDNVESFFTGSLGAVRMHGDALPGLAIATNYLNDNAYFSQAGVVDDAWWTNAGTADWNNGASWLGGAAPVNQTILVTNGGTVVVSSDQTARMAVVERGRVRIDGGNLTAAFETVIGAGVGGDARLDVNAGSFISTGFSPTVAGETGSTGTLFVAAGAAINDTTGGIRVGLFEGVGILTNLGTINAGGELWIGNGPVRSSGSLVNDGGTITVGSRVCIGRFQGTGMLEMKGGTLTKAGAGDFTIGDNGGTGTMSLDNGATVDIATGPYWQAHMANGQGYVTNNDSTLIKQAANVFGIGRADGTMGVFVQNGAQSVTAISNGWVSIGENGTGRGFYTLNDGWLFHAASDFNIADIGVSRGFYQQYGGTASVNRLLIGKNNNTAGFFTLHGGVFIDRDGSGDTVIGGYNNLSNTYGSLVIRGGAMEHYDNFQVGGGGLGVFEQSGGSFYHAAGYPVIGRFPTGIGVAHLTGGTFTRAVNEILIVGEQGTGVVTIAGTASVTSAAPMSVGHAVGGVGVVNLNGGTLTVANIYSANAAAISVFNFNGGTLKPLNPTTTFMAGMDAATVFAGGARIDTDGKDITIDQVLSAPAGNGVASIPVIAGGSGYAGSPIVRILGDGMGATAFAEVDLVMGAVTNIVITCPGWGYTVPPTVELLGGDGGGVSLGEATLAPNVGGGLVKTGAGVLTLNGDNTYAGPTTVSGGTLSVRGAHTGGGPVTVSGTLAGTGSLASPVTILSGGQLSPGVNIGTLTVNHNLTLNAGAVLNFQLGTTSDRMIVTGNLTLGGLLRITNSGGFGLGTYTLFLYDGTLSGPLPTIDSAPAGFSYQVTTNMPGLVRLVVSPEVQDPYELWQIQYFGSTTNPLAARNADADGDLQINDAEFRSGTVPTNKLSALLLVQESKSGNDLVLTWTTAGVRTNQLEVSGDLAPGSFSNLGAQVILPVAGDAVTNYIDVGAATNRGPRFYRVRLVDP